MVKNLPAMWKTWIQSLGWEDALEEGMKKYGYQLRISKKSEDMQLLSTRITTTESVCYNERSCNPVQPNYLILKRRGPSQVVKW